MHGIGDDCLQDFRLPENVDNINVAPDPEHPENTTFTKMFDQALKDVNQEYGTDDLQQTNEAPAPAPNKPMTLSYRRAEDKIKARMGIMGFKEDLVKMRRCADGSMIISAYTTEDDLADDSKTKNGKVLHKKAFAIKFNIVNGVPEVAAYMPPGKALSPSMPNVCWKRSSLRDVPIIVFPAVRLICRVPVWMLSGRLRPKP